MIRKRIVFLLGLAAVLAAFLLAILLLAKPALGEPQTVDNKPLDAIADKRILELELVCPDRTVQAVDDMLAGSPMAGLGQAVVSSGRTWNVNPTLIVGIAEAESQRGLHMRTNNPFGLMRTGHELRAYPDVQAAIEDEAEFLSLHWPSDITPERMVRGYVGHDAPYWVVNVRKYFSE